MKGFKAESECALVERGRDHLPLSGVVVKSHEAIAEHPVLAPSLSSFSQQDANPERAQQ